LDKSVEHLRHIRSLEKKAKKQVLEFNDVFEKYQKDADFDAFKKVAKNYGYYL
jgi:vacuolar-type H+-ATPase subunit H